MTRTQKIFYFIRWLIGGELLQFILIRFGTRLVKNPWQFIVFDALVVVVVFLIVRRQSLQAAIGMLAGTAIFVASMLLFT